MSSASKYASDVAAAGFVRPPHTKYSPAPMREKVWKTSAWGSRVTGDVEAATALDGSAVVAVVVVESSPAVNTRSSPSCKL